MHRPFLRLALMAFCLGGPSLHAAYNPGLVSADARWVVYLDLNGLRASALGKEFITAIEASQKQATNGAVGLDVSKLLATVGTLTAYGTNFAADPHLIDGALIAQGTPDLRKITESLLLQGTLTEPKVFAEVTDLPFPAYAISDPHAKAEDKTQLVVAFPPEPVVLVSKSKAQLVKARDVVRGAAPSLAKAARTPLTNTAGTEGAYLYSATLVPTEEVFPKNSPHARILQLTEFGSLAIGDRGADTFAHAALIASSDANADRLMKIMQGVTALIGLAETSDAQLGAFLRATEVRRDKNTVMVDIAYPSARLAQMIQTMHAQAEAPAPKRKGVPAITMGRVVGEWTSAAGTGLGSDEEMTRTFENVALVNGSTITFGRQLRGAKSARLVSLEIMPAEGAGSPMTIRPEFMREVRGSMWQFPFPGAPGTYTLRVTYLPDAEGQTKFALSVADPKPATDKSK